MVRNGAHFHPRIPSFPTLERAVATKQWKILQKHASSLMEATFCTVNTIFSRNIEPCGLPGGAGWPRRLSEPQGGDALRRCGRLGGGPFLHCGYGLASVGHGAPRRRVTLGCSISNAATAPMPTCGL